MRSPARILPLLALALAAACAEQGTLEPRPDPSFASAGRGAKQVTVMSRNMYIGADVDPVLAAIASGNDALIYAALQRALAEFNRTDVATRIQGIADEIARNRPAVVGLQEVYELYLGDAYINFLAILQQALAARGATYDVAVVSTLTDADLGPVRLVDHDALLVEHDRVIPGPTFAHVFVANIPPEYTDPVEVKRGYVGMFATIDGIPVLLINAHLESGSSDPIKYIRSLQAGELAQVVTGYAPMPVILTGDFNDVAGSSAYTPLASAGLTDTWAAMRPGVAGYSCCQLADLSNHNSILDERIDFVWTRGFAGPSGKPQGQISLISNTPSALLAGEYGSVWPSDHAGLFATLLLPASMGR